MDPLPIGVLFGDLVGRAGHGLAASSFLILTRARFVLIIQSPPRQLLTLATVSGFEMGFFI